jgi:rhodanese-related sulfurtransferase
MKQSVQQMMAAANAVIDTTSVHDAIASLDNKNIVFVDIRDALERTQAGEIPNAIHAPRGHLEFIADPATTMHNPVFASGKQLLLFCASGGRSTLATKTLLDMGLPDVAHIAGGFSAWKEAGGPIQFRE